MFRGVFDGDAKTFQRGFEAATPAAVRNISKGVGFYFKELIHAEAIQLQRT